MLNWINPQNRTLKTKMKTEFVKNIQQISYELLQDTSKSSVQTYVTVALHWHSDLTHFTCTCDSHNLCAMQTHAVLPTAHLFTSEQTADMETREHSGSLCEVIHDVSFANSIDWLISQYEPNTPTQALEERSLVRKIAMRVAGWFPIGFL